MLDLLFPPVCSACGIRIGRESQLCHDCLGKLRYLTPPWCSQCGMPQSQEGVCFHCRQNSLSLEAVRSVFVYEEPLRGLIHRWKFSDHPELFYFFARQMFLFSQLYFPPESWDLITAVPLHPARERERDYNQSFLLAEALGKSFEVPFSAKTLRRVRGTQPQSKLSETDRRRNVKFAFHAAQDLANGKRILLVDDLLTTGATLNQCASSLKEAGARRVDGLTLARTPLT